MNKQQLAMYLKEMFNARWVQEQDEFRFKYCDVCFCLAVDTKTDNATYDTYVNCITLFHRDVDNFTVSSYGHDRIPVHAVGFLAHKDTPINRKSIQEWLLPHLITKSLS
jgi:hypothetical protein